VTDFNASVLDINGQPAKADGDTDLRIGDVVCTALMAPTTATTRMETATRLSIIVNPFFILYIR